MDTDAQEAFSDSADVLHATDAIISGMRAAVAGGRHWFLAVLDAIGSWRLPEEYAGGRYYRYLIGGEAFDWLVLAERLCAELEDLAPEDERESLLFHGRLPVSVTEDEFRRALGPAKYRAHLNYLYGVTVEESLQLAVDEDVQKELRCRVVGHDRRSDETLYHRIYGKPRDELLARFCEARSLPPADRLSLADWKAFTYWLFKYRVHACDPARVASDTRRGLTRLSLLEAMHRRSPVFTVSTAADIIDPPVVSS